MKMRHPKRFELMIAAVIVGILVCVLIVVSQIYSTSDIETNLHNSTACSKTIHLGRTYYFHTCLKDNKRVFDIRHFFKNDEGSLKPYFVGVQLNEDEFIKLCQSECNSQ